MNSTNPSKNNTVSSDLTGFLWSLIDDHRQTWHDKLAKTYVIYAWEAEGSGRLIRQLKARRKKHGSTVE